MVFKAITANRLRDGAVVFLTGAGAWSRDVNCSALADNAASEQRLMKLAAAAERRRQVVGTYAIDVESTGRSVQPLRYRELIRANGPSVEYGRPGTVPPARWKAA